MNIFPSAGLGCRCNNGFKLIKSLGNPTTLTCEKCPGEQVSSGFELACFMEKKLLSISNSVDDIFLISSGHILLICLNLKYLVFFQFETRLKNTC